MNIKKKHINTWNIWWIIQIIIPIITCIVLFTFKIPLNRYVLIGVGVTLNFISIYTLDKKGYEISLKIILISIVIMILAMFISASIFETTVDGQWYHYDAINAIMEGWNPLYNTNFDRIGSANFIYSEHYPKGTWIFGAFYGCIFKNIEIGKVYNLYAIFLLFGMTCSYLYENKEKTNTLTKILILICVVLNPIAIAQLNTYYADGWMGNLFLVYCIGVYLSYTKKDVLYTIVASLAMIMVINTKYTGLGYIGIIGLWLLIVILKYSKNERYHWKKLFIPLVICGLISVLYIGFDSYVRNTFDHKHPFYPISGENTIDIMTSNTPASFRGDSYLVKMAKSYFSETSSSLERNILKSPLSVSEDEFEQMNQDTRIAGFGPLFALGIILSIISLIMIYKEGVIKEVLLLNIPLILTVAINPENWWARYVPQLWIIPIIVFMISMKKTNTNNTKILGLIGLLVLTVNSCLSFKYLSVYQYKKSEEQKQAIMSLSKYDKIYVNLQNPAMISLQHKMSLLNVSSEKVEDINYEKVELIEIPYTFSAKVAIPK